MFIMGTTMHVSWRKREQRAVLGCCWQCFGDGPAPSRRQDDACLAAAMSPSVAYHMVSARSQRRVTALEFLSHPAASGKSELVRGEIHVMTPASGVHGIVAG